ncbi:MAG: hypothetical protein ABIA63_01955 [bacterium]
MFLPNPRFRVVFPGKHIKITGIPIDTIHTASTRIRFFRLLKYLPAGFKSSLYKDDIECDILYIQKNARPEIIRAAKTAVQRKIPVIYDIDDDFGVWPGMDETGMMNMATAVTTNTPERAAYLKNYTKTPIHIIPDCLDYIEKRNKPVHINKSIRSVATFGSNFTISISAAYLNHFPRYLAQSYFCADKSKKVINGNFIKWRLKPFLKQLKCFDVCLLAQNNDNRGRMKSSNRLLVCMSVGIPAIVSDTPAYSKIMKELELNYLIADSPLKINYILELISPVDIRREISSKFFKYAWSNHAPEAVSNKFAQLIHNIRNANQQ